MRKSQVKAWWLKKQKSGVNSLTCFSDNHAAVAAQLGKQLSEPTPLWCFLIGWDLFGLGGFFQGNFGGTQILHVLLTKSLEDSTATATPG